MEISFSSEHSSISQRNLAFQAMAVDIQMRRDFAPAWGFEPWPCSAYLSITGLDKSLYHPVFFMDNIGDNALGFHDDLLNYIYSRVMTPVDPNDASTASHEAVEMRADPDCSLYAMMADGREVAVETGDPVEADSYVIPVTLVGETRGIWVSNFVLPSYFIPDSPGPWDHLGQLTGSAPHMTPGGYVILRDPASGEVSNVFADRRGARSLSMKRGDPLSRTGRRLALSR